MMNTAKEQCVLDLLADGGWWYGLDIVDRSDGLLKRGTVYITLARMEEKGLIEGRKEKQLMPGMIPRRMYRKVAA